MNEIFRDFCTHLEGRVVEEGRHAVERRRTDLGLVDRPAVLSTTIETLGSVSVPVRGINRPGTEFAIKEATLLSSSLLGGLYFKAVVAYRQRSRMYP